MRIAGGPQQQDEAAACRPRSQCCAKDSTSGNHGAEQFGLKKLGYQVGDGHRSPAQDAVHIFLAQLAQAAPGFEHAPEIGTARTVDVGGGSLSASAITAPIFLSDSCSTGYCAASLAENFAISAAEHFTSL